MQLWKLYLKLLQISSDIYNTGIYLAGGFYERIGQKNFSKNRLPVYIARSIKSSSSRNRMKKPFEI
jgi:hypothetical protein